jgi:hypothetical protein
MYRPVHGETASLPIVGAVLISLILCSWPCPALFLRLVFFGFRFLFALLLFCFPLRSPKIQDLVTSPAPPPLPLLSFHQRPLLVCYQPAFSALSAAEHCPATSSHRARSVHRGRGVAACDLRRGTASQWNESTLDGLLTDPNQRVQHRPLPTFDSSICDSQPRASSLSTHHKPRPHASSRETQETQIRAGPSRSVGIVTTPLAHPPRKDSNRSVLDPKSPTRHSSWSMSPDRSNRGTNASLQKADSIRLYML